jgi:hypothetical protein
VQNRIVSQSHTMCVELRAISDVCCIRMGNSCNGYTVFGLNRGTNRCWLDTVGYCHTSTASITMGVSWVKPSVMSMWPERVFKRVS